MNEDVFNASLRKFLKQVGVTSQREIEKAVRDALASGKLKGHEKLQAKMTLTIGSVGLAGESQIATATENQNNQSWTWPSFIERGFAGFRAYYDYVPKGKFEIEYTIRLNQPGTFQLPATHVQALYEPEMLGDLPNAAFTVTP